MVSDPIQHNQTTKPFQRQEIIEDILKELDKAEYKFPQWPNDHIHGTAIMAEESGEAVRASVQLVYEKGDIEDLRKELMHTAAMCIRELAHIDYFPQLPHPCPWHNK